MTLISELAGFVSETSYGNLPKYVVEATKLRILDTIGGAIWGRHEGNSSRLIGLANEFGGNTEAVLWGGSKKIPSIWAAFINGYSSFYISDTDRFCGCHPGAVVVPAAMAAGEKNDVSGKDFITGVALGYEVLSRVGLAIFPAISKRGFHATGVLGPLGSTAAASKIFSLNKEMTIHALSIAATMGAGLGEAFQYLDTVSLNIGRVSQAGILAALMVQKGYKGSNAILEGGNFIKEGFLSAFAGTYDPDLITRDLGKEYAIPNVAPKIHYGCRHLAAPTDAVMDLVSKYNLKADDIEEIRIRQYSEAIRLDRSEVRNRDDALWSSRFTIAVAISTGEPAYPSRFTQEMIHDKAIQKVMAKVKTEVNPELDKEFPRKWPAQAEIITKDGKKHQSTLDYPRGEPENPVPKEELYNKFRALVSPDFGNETAEKIIGVVENLESGNLSHLASILLCNDKS